MNLKSISYYLSLFLFPLSVLSFINILYSSYFNYFLSIESYLITLVVSLVLACGLYLFGKNAERKITYINQLILIIFVYFIVGILVSVPIYMSNSQIIFVNALFESISGLTGTGFSTFTSVKYLDPTLILWRSSSQWLGGLYFLIFLILIFSNKTFNYKMTSLTFTSESAFNSEESVKGNIFKILIFYCIISFTILILLSFSDVRLFNSLNFTMTLVSAGGFLPTDNLNDIISTKLQKIILIFSLLFSYLNFYFLFNLFKRKIFIKNHREDFYLLSIVILSVLLTYLNNFDGLNTIINVTSSLANSGITLIEDNNNFSLFFLFLTIIGGSLISNTSGIKFSRFYILLKITTAEILKLISPNSIINKTIFNSENKITDENVKISFLIFISFFLSLLILSSCLVLDDIGFESSFKLAILALTNTVNSEMHGLDNLVFANMLTSSKISLIIFMIIGKIELISIFLIFKKFFFKD